MSINCFIPSMDRALQLNLLLDSLEKNIPGVFSPYVMYKSSTTDFDKGYQIVIDKWINRSDKIEFELEYNCVEQFYGFLESNKDKLVCLFSDDCIFYRQSRINENVLKNIFKNENLFSFTFRLGKNITVKNYVWHENMQLPDIYHLWGKVRAWDRTKLDFWQLHGFSVGFDGYVFRANDLLKLAEYKSFDKICLWEHMICRQFLEKGSPRNLMASPHNSEVFVQQINVVHGMPHNSTRRFNKTTKELNEVLLSGKEIDLDSMDFSNTNCTHGEIPWQYIERKKYGYLTSV